MAKLSNVAGVGIAQEIAEPLINISTSTTSDLTSFSRSDDGVAIVAINSPDAIIAKRVQSEYLPTNQESYTLLVSPGNNAWIDAQARFPFITSATAKYGMRITVVSSVQVDVEFGGDGPSAGESWSSYTSWKWKLLKHRDGGTINTGAAHTTRSGLINTQAQSFSGDKTFVGNVDVHGTLTASNFAPGSISTSSLADGCVTNEKLGDNSVTTASLADGSVTNVKLGDSSVIASKIADGQITDAKMTTGMQQRLANGFIKKQIVNRRPVITQPISNTGGYSTISLYGPFGYNVPPVQPGAERRFRLYAVYSDNINSTSGQGNPSLVSFLLSGYSYTSFGFYGWHSWSIPLGNYNFYLPLTWGDANTPRDALSNEIVGPLSTAHATMYFGAFDDDSNRTVKIYYMEIQTLDVFP